MERPIKNGRSTRFTHRYGIEFATVRGGVRTRREPSWARICASGPGGTRELGRSGRFIGSGSHARGTGELGTRLWPPTTFPRIPRRGADRRDSSFSSQRMGPRDEIVGPHPLHVVDQLLHLSPHRIKTGPEPLKVVPQPLKIVAHRLTIVAQHLNIDHQQ